MPYSAEIWFSFLEFCVRGKIGAGLRPALELSAGMAVDMPESAYNGPSSR